MQKAKTLGELKKCNYRSVGVRDEMRANLLRKLEAGEPLEDATVWNVGPKTRLGVPSAGTNRQQPYSRRSLRWNSVSSGAS